MFASPIWCTLFLLSSRHSLSCHASLRYKLDRAINDTQVNGLPFCGWRRSHQAIFLDLRDYCVTLHLLSIYQMSSHVGVRCWIKNEVLRLSPNDIYMHSCWCCKLCHKCCSWLSHYLNYHTRVQLAEARIVYAKLHSRTRVHAMSKGARTA